MQNKAAQLPPRQNGTLLSLNSFREEPVDQCLWHPEFYRAKCVLATPVQPQGIRWPSGGWNLRVEGLCTCAKMEAVGRGLREGGKSSQVKAVSSPGEFRKQGRNGLRRRQRKREQWKSSVLHVISNYWVRERCSNCSNPPSLPLSLPRTAVATAPWSPPRRARRAPCLCSPGQTDCAVKESSKVSSR